MLGNAAHDNRKALPLRERVELLVELLKLAAENSRDSQNWLFNSTCKRGKVSVLAAINLVDLAPKPEVVLSGL